nr:HAMP domain-containing histidine kinase [Desulfobulbaceae bacterium]
MFRSKSFFLFVLSGLALVALPLVLVLISSDFLMGKLVKQSSTSVYRSVSSAQLGLKLVENITNQERKIRQYLVLGDARLYEDVLGLHKEIINILNGLETLTQQEAQARRVRVLKEQEGAIFSALKLAAENSEQTTLLSNSFVELDRLGKEMYMLSNEETYKEVEKLQNSATHARATLLTLAFTLLPITIALIAFLARLITKPIKEIDRGIKQLGQGNFVSPIAITGPEDLIFLGRRLNWLRKKLAKYEKEKNKFAAHISHELKTPLASIYEGTELLNDEIVGPVNVKQREVVEILRKNCFQLQQHIENLVSYTMAQAQKTALIVSQFSVNDLILQCLEDYKSVIMKNSLTLTTEIDHFDIVADRERIKTVIDNLLSNAFKYSPFKGALLVSASVENDFCQLLVADSGQGISVEDKEFIFSPFYQGSSTGHTHIKGTGLGLAIAHEYVTAHGGTIELASSPLCGACFKVLLPLDDSRQV